MHWLNYCALNKYSFIIYFAFAIENIAYTILCTMQKFQEKYFSSCSMKYKNIF